MAPHDLLGLDLRAGDCQLPGHDGTSTLLTILQTNGSPSGPLSIPGANLSSFLGIYLVAVWSLAATPGLGKEREGEGSEEHERRL